MVTAALKERLRDPDYLGMHLAAVAAVKEIKGFPWYDSQFLQMFEAARRYLREVRPDLLATFEAAFEPLRTPSDFAVGQIEGLFPAEVLQRIRDEVVALPAAQLELHERTTFGRNFVHDHPYFVELQRALLPRVSDMAGRELEAGYNFLSLYGTSGRCEPHLDQPISMYTLDFCIDQSAEWPIYFSDVIDWPIAEEMNAFDAEALLADPAIRFTEYVLRPNNAILFSGSGQWHYREAMKQPGFCSLLFFHYYPKECGDLVLPASWPKVLGIPELGPLVDVLIEAFPRYMQVGE